MAMLALARQFPGCPILFMDADTFAVAPLAALLERVGRGAVMYEREYNVAARQSPMMVRFRRNLARARHRGQPIDLDVDMWNSGVVGLGPELTPIIEPWIEFLDEVYPSTRRWVLEQFALAYLLQKRGTPISAADDLAVHYWDDKPGRLAAIRGQLEATKGLPLEDLLEHVRTHSLRAPRPAARVRSVNLFQRFFGW